MLIVDACALLKLVVGEPDSERAREVIAVRDDCVAPSIILVEAASALAKKVRFAGLPVDAARQAYANLPQFLVEIVDTALLLPRAMALSVELDHSVFDCVYLALALDRRCALLTADMQFAKRAISAGYAANINTLR